MRQGAVVSELNKAAVRRLIAEVLNGGRLEVIDELYAPELAPAARRWITPFRASFPDVHMGDRGADRRGRQGRRPVHLLGHPPGRLARPCCDWAPLRERVDEVAIFQLRDGRIVHVWSLEDNLGRLQQRGLF
jgi:hypothetical protein